MKCKKCKEEFACARFQADVRNYGEVDLGSGEFSIRDYGDWLNIKYHCPDCDVEITKEVEEVL
jgi:ribosomal protein L37AE/L43A|tara:strand:+ start:1737 stop:1925 length:189 start_codon:yes stop_codon:yes gene_type:complete